LRGTFAEKNHVPDSKAHVTPLANPLARITSFSINTLRELTFFDRNLHEP